MKSIFSISELEIKARELRVDVIRSLTAAGSGHLGGSLGLADVFAVLYFHELKHNPAEPLWSERDRLVLSIGHVAPILYAALANSGYFDREELLTLRKLGSRLQGHPGRDHGLPGIELSAGSLGQGLSVAVGMALADKMDKNRRRVYVVLGDGELQEGSVWEAAMSASHYNLDNLIALVDRNRVQIDGRVKNVMEIEPLADKWKAFGWYVIECDGNSIDELIHAFEKARSIVEKPVVILANTLMGKGIPEIENDYRWHGKVPTQAEAVRFINTLLSDGITN
ncbi:MAG TPA: transketolase [Bacteroidales bacterium]|nr:MAG: Transketolase 1 [Bacteroidetes bacterium ADurb.Bin041]HNV49955.1 transketolase [Bacteroidales bacterium]HNY59597.1 transketolase [Bacteroidales bacterium]HOG66680.1 transketolase [Bacteroidales bacterium]HPA13107.1 transketolase [Bacteroidales bacterium]